jgi:ATP-GRASP peptide maturase of grasp-with-spasm system
MILIISFNYERSTSDIAEWLLYYKSHFNILTETNVTNYVYYVQTNEEHNQISITTHDGSTINFDDVNSVWYRRGKFFNGNKSIVNDLSNKEIDYFIKIAEKEWECVNDLLLLTLLPKTLIGNYLKSNLNKLQVLQIAKSVGLTIPNTFITSKKKDVNVSSRIINKTISNIAHIAIENKLFYNRTVEIDATLLPETFSVSMFQELIIKKYELRIFFLNDIFYTSAIFSQNDDKTVIDFRNYNHVKPSRTVPFELPDNIKKKLKRLIQKLGLNTGSIDMMVTTDNKYVFLEVNPDGQFGMVSYPCNYYIERDLATLLKKA